MRSTKIRTIHNEKVCALIILLLLMSAGALGRYAINWYTIDCGGGTSSDTGITVTTMIRDRFINW